LITLIRHLADLTRDPASPHDPLYTCTRVMRQFVEEVDRARSAGIVDHDGWEAALIAIRRDRSFKDGRKGSTRIPGVAPRLPVTALEDFERAANADRRPLHAELRGGLERTSG
jgi:hypothetical protein